MKVKGRPFDTIMRNIKFSKYGLSFSDNERVTYLATDVCFLGELVFEISELVEIVVEISSPDAESDNLPSNLCTGNIIKKNHCNYDTVVLPSLLFLLASSGTDHERISKTSSLLYSTLKFGQSLR